MSRSVLLLLDVLAGVVPGVMALLVALRCTRGVSSSLVRWFVVVLAAAVLGVVGGLVHRWWLARTVDPV